MKLKVRYAIPMLISTIFAHSVSNALTPECTSLDMDWFITKGNVAQYTPGNVSLTWPASQFHIKKNLGEDYILADGAVGFADQNTDFLISYADGFVQSYDVTAPNYAQRDAKHRFWTNSAAVSSPVPAVQLSTARPSSITSCAITNRYLDVVLDGQYQHEDGPRVSGSLTAKCSSFRRYFTADHPYQDMSVGNYVCKTLDVKVSSGSEVKSRFSGSPAGGYSPGNIGSVTFKIRK